MRTRTEARRKYEAEWREKNRERHRANQRRWREENPERHSATKRRWNDANRDLLRQRSREAYAKLTAQDRRPKLPLPTRPAPDRCESCTRLFSETKRGPCLDHDHITGKFRGWLCQKCNTAYGMVGDCVAGARLLLDYAERTQ